MQDDTVGGDAADAGDVGGRDVAPDADLSPDADSADADDVGGDEVPFGRFGGCTIGLGTTSIVVVGQSPTRVYTIAGLSCALAVGAATYDDAPLDLEQDGTNAYLSTESQIVVSSIVGLGESASIDMQRPVLANGLGVLFAASESGPVLGLSASLTESARSADTEFIELIGCIDIESSGSNLYGLCRWNANDETYAGVLEFVGNPLRPSILFTAAPGSLPRALAVVDSTVYLLEATQPAVYTIAPSVDPVATDLSATFPAVDGFSSLSGDMFSVAGDIWLTTIGDERGQIYSVSFGTFTRTGNAAAGIPDVDVYDISQVDFSSYAVAVTPWIEDLSDGRRVEGMQLLEITTGREVIGRAVFNGIFPAFVR